jgi:hypothetical protein
MNFISAAVNGFFDLFFGCHHDRLTRPFTIEDETYKVCLECGKHVFYSPITMRPLSHRELRRLRQSRTRPMPTVAPDFLPAADSKVSAA